MATLTPVAQASADTTHLIKVAQITGDEYAGEVLNTCSPVYKKAADGLWYMSNGTAANEAATVWGFTPRTVQIGQPVTAYGIGFRCRYGVGLTIGTKLYASATAGSLDNAATTGGTVAIARVISATDIQVIALS